MNQAVTDINDKTQTQAANNGIFIVLLIGSMIGSFLQTAMTTALPAIMQDFGVTAAVGQWLTSAYTLAMGIMIPATAFLIRRFPVKKLFLLFMTLFTAGSFLSASAGSFFFLMLGRIMQALGSGVLLSITQVVILTIYPPEKRGTMMGIYGLAVGAIPVFAPALAGVIVDISSWRTIFWISAILISLDVLVAAKVLTSPLETMIQRFDTLSMVLCAAGFGGLILGLGNIGTYRPAYVVILLSIGCLSLIIFALRQLRMDEPFLDLRILANREFRLSVILSMLMYIILMAGSVLLPLYIQSVRGYSATLSGLVTMPGSLVMALVSPLAGRIYDKIGIRKLLYMGSGLLLLSCISMCMVSDQTSMLYVGGVFALRLLAIGLIMMPLTTWGLSTISPDSTANGTALYTSLRTIAGSIGSAVFAILMTLATSSLHNPNPESQLFGMNVSFIGISAIAAVLFVIAMIGIRKEPRVMAN